MTITSYKNVEYSVFITQGHHPLCVVGTAGTTVAGAYDPLHSLADICSRHGVWLHVDMIWGGGAILSAKHRHLLDGIDRWGL